ncbi:hypothetical protein BGZ50_001079 [Haplosporangium sp. Z 11]|nr:hypothetical protein BGZ50_001079 [Haplosporangium sp. Z 11]
MPDVIPKWIMIKRAIDTLATGIKVVLRAILVISIWLVILPYLTIWMWRLYFWVGDWFAFGSNGLEVPVKKAVNMTTTNNATSVLKSYEQMDSFTRFVHRTIPSEYKFFSKFVLDCFEGQIVSAVVVVVFVAVFLLREWVLQNQEAEEVARPGDPRRIDQAEIEDADALGRFIAAQQQQQQRQQLEAARRIVQHQQQLEAIRRAAQQHGQQQERPLDDALRHALFEIEDQVQRDRRDLDASSGDPTNRHTNHHGVWENEPDTTNENNDLRAGRLNSPSSSQDLYPSSGESSSSFMAGYVYDPLSQTYHPDSQWVQGGSSSAHINNTFDGTASHHYGQVEPDNGEGSSSGRTAASINGSSQIRTRNHQPLYWKEGVPLTYHNVYLHPDGTEMSLDEKLTRYEGLIQLYELSPGDTARLLDRRNVQADSPIDRLLHHQMNMSAEERLRTVQQPRHDEEAMDRHNATLRQEQDTLRIPHPENAGPVQRPVVVPQPIPPLAPRRPAAPVAIPAAPAPPAAPVDPNAAMDPNVDVDDMNAEELDGILEVIGMRGSYWLLLQNSLLMSALICASLGIGVWIPYMLGKTTLLMNLFNVLRIPLWILSSLTDPIIDFVIDRILPFLGVIITKPATVLWTQISVFSSPLLEYFLDSQTLRPAGDLVQEYVTSTFNAIVDVSKSLVPSPVENAVKESAVVPLIQVSVSTDGDVYQQIIAKWNDLAYGTSSNDKVVAIAVGYSIMFALATWYMKRTPRSYNNNSIGQIARDVIRQIAFFVSLEMVAFPLFCGIVVGLTTLPVFPGATLASRWAFYQQSPNWSIIMHWLLGTAFMFNFSMFVSICRSAVRPGVMWFIRDPNDEGFHPVREILERPVLLQLRKLGTGALMYLTRNALPSSEPISDLPIDMLLFHLVVPLTFRWLNPSNRFKALFVGWWRKLAQWLRLSSFMYGAEGERYPEEEGYTVYRTWKAWLLRYKAPIPGLDAGNENAAGSGEELDINAPVAFVRDGGLYRVPNTDRVVHLKNRRVLVPVDAEGHALDPKEDLPGEIDPLMEIQPRGRDPHQPIDPKAGTVVVYAPPNFKRRLISFIVIMWTTSTAFLALAVVVPLILGRSLLTFATERQVHDVYSFAIGVYAISGIWHLQEWLLSAHRTVASHGFPSMDIRACTRSVMYVGKLIAKVAYFGIVFGILFPLTLGLMVELFLIIPLRVAVHGDAGVIFVISWAVGLLYMKIVHKFLNAFPENRFTIDMNRVFVDTDVATWDIVLATRRLVLPALGLVAVIVGSPMTVAWSLTKALGIEGAAKAKLFKLSYPTMLLVCLIVLGFRESALILNVWYRYVRDQEYIIGRRLQNLSEEEEEEEEEDANATSSERSQHQPGHSATVGGGGSNLAADNQRMDETVPLLRSTRRDAFEDGDELDGDYIDVPDLEPVSRFGESSSSSGGRQSLDGKYGIRSFSAHDSSQHEPMDISEDEGIDERDEETVADRTRFRRSQRLQAIRESHADR